MMGGNRDGVAGGDKSVTAKPGVHSFVLPQAETKLYKVSTGCIKVAAW